jgi:predicted nucleic acid-binding protein
VRALLDTSFFVASEAGRSLGEPAGVDETEVSVVTLAELTLGVLMADDNERPRRLSTLSAVESTWAALPIDAAVAREFARIVADLRGRGRRVSVLDALVAATALVERIPVVTQHRDYQAITGLSVISV